MDSTTIGLLLTLACPLRCRHCYLSSGPERTEEFEHDSLEAVIRTIASTGRFSTICFSGGEPFYRKELLSSAIHLATSHRLNSAVVTSGFWAGTPESALHTLKSLPPVTELHLSTDTFHQEYIPPEYVVNAIKAARELNIWAVTLGITTLQPLEEAAMKRFFSDYLDDRYIFSQALIPLGRGAHQLREEELTMGFMETPCDDLRMQAITPSLDILACCGPVLSLPVGHPLRAGNLKNENLVDVLNRINDDPILNLMKLCGPWKAARILEHTEAAPSPGSRFIKGCACDLCLTLLGDDRYLKILRVLMTGLLGKEIEEITSLRKKIENFGTGR